jgi:glutathione S-transferase
VSDPILYHFPPSTCSQKVRMALVEKGVPFESVLINILAGEQHAPDYVTLNPDHVVPTLVLDGEAFTESTLINEFVDDHFAGPALRPVESIQRYRSAALTRFVDTRIHGKVSGVPTHAILTRGMLADRTAEQISAYLAAIPDPAERALRESLLTHGVHAPEMLGGLKAIARLLARLEAQLAWHPWLSGDNFGLGDIGVLPYLVRFGALGLDGLWTGGRPRVTDWLARATARPSFHAAFTKWMPDAMAHTFARLAAEVRPQLEPMMQEANQVD